MAQSLMDKYAGQSMLLPPYDHPWVIAGQSTIALEFLQQVPNLGTYLLFVSIHLTIVCVRHFCSICTPVQCTRMHASNVWIICMFMVILYAYIVDILVVPVGGGGMLAGNSRSLPVLSCLALGSQSTHARHQTPPGRSGRKRGRGFLMRLFSVCTHTATLYCFCCLRTSVVLCCFGVCWLVRVVYVVTFLVLYVGICIAAKAVKPSIKIYAAEPYNASDAAESIQHNTIIPAKTTHTIADGLRTSLVTPIRESGRGRRTMRWETTRGAEGVMGQPGPSLYMIGV